jgi:hypothetical protein
MARHVRMMRRAISPRFAIRMRRNIFKSCLPAGS